MRQKRTGKATSMLVETLVCIAIGSIVTILLLTMCVTTYKVLTYELREQQQQITEQQKQIEELEKAIF